MKEICIQLAALLHTNYEFRWSAVFSAFGSNNYLTDKDLARAIQQLYSGARSFNDLILYKDAMPGVSENNQVAVLRQELFTKVKQALTT